MWGSSPIFVVVLTAVAAPSIIPAEKWKLELSLRDQRNMMIRESLDAGRCVFYTSSGTSMWPLVQSNDACLFHPIQAVTAEDGVHAIQKDASEIGVGDIVFCKVQPSQQYYAHIVLCIEQGCNESEPRYGIGNIELRHNGWCRRKHIFGILVDVQERGDGQYHSRPLPKTVFGAAAGKGRSLEQRGRQTE